MTAMPGGPAHEPEREEPPREEFGGEVRIGGGPAPRWLRYWYYLVYLWAILYLLIQPGLDRYWIAATFAVLLTVWLGYIWWKKKPPEP
jgi:hypothetical protein